MKITKGIMAILLALFLIGNVFGQAGLGFQAIENAGKITITGYTGTETNLAIPETANGMPIVEIGKEAFSGKGLNSITIPSSVIRIGDSAFANNNLNSVTIGANVTLGNSAISDGFDTTYNNAGKPAGTYKMEWDSNLNIYWGMPSGDYLYIGSTITRYTGSGGTVTIPSAINGTPITSIARNAFYEKRLTSVTIPASVTTIGELAFFGNQLTSITIPNSVTTIKDAAFYGNQLTSVTIPNSVTTIGGEAFCKNQLTSVTISNSVKTIGHYAFANNQLTSITIGPNVQITGEAFPISFINAYNKIAGTYTRPSTSSNTWTKGAFTF